jgi:hypothetical protein
MLARLTLKEMTNRPVIIAVVAFSEPVTDMMIARMGLASLSMSSTEPIAEMRTLTMMKPRTPFMKMDQNMARGTADLAFRVSSLMWMALSKPGVVR